MWVEQHKNKENIFFHGFIILILRSKVNYHHHLKEVDFSLNLLNSVRYLVVESIVTDVLFSCYSLRLEHKNICRKAHEAKLSPLSAFLLLGG